MTWLFLRFYTGVLLVLFLAWWIHGYVWQDRTAADRARVVVEAHGGGARLIAQELQSVDPEDWTKNLEQIRERFAYPVELRSRSDLPGERTSLRQQTSGVFHLRFRNDDFVAAELPDRDEVVLLGPFPDYQLKAIEDSIGGWMRLAAERVGAASPDAREATLSDLQDIFDLPIEMTPSDELPEWPKWRLLQGTEIVFFPRESIEDERWYAATPIGEDGLTLQFGPFPAFEQIEQKAATTTLALVLLPSALAIALLLRPVTLQLRRIERAAESIASGDLSARVAEHRVRSAKPLAQAFNHMASHTEALVRTQRELLQAVSHELRTPLARMRFAIDLIESTTDEDERKQRLESLDAATQELDDLVGELLSYVRMETAAPQLNLQETHLQKRLEQLVGQQATLQPQTRFEISNSESDVVVLVDPTGFERAIGNLIRNAGRYARHQVTIGVEKSADSLAINVDDDGPGIPQADRARVLDPFVRLEDDSGGRGAGLGLALVQRIVSQHGGQVEIGPSPHGGCRVRTTWPQDPSAD